MKHVRQGFTLLQIAGVALKLEKCSFFTNMIDYLKHVIRRRQLKIAPHTADKRKHH